MEITITLDMQAIEALENAAVKAAKNTMEQLDSNLETSATMPFNDGNMQNGGTYVYVRKDGTTRVGATVKGNEVVDLSEDGIIHMALTNDAPQARRLYYHPEYDFLQGHNANAGGEWLKPYISGDKKDFVPETYAELFKKETGV